MRIESAERSTGMGATRYTAVAVDGRWVPVSRMPSVRYHGREAGVHYYSVEVADSVPSATFYRSNSGKETVTVSTGQEFHSFEDAHDWLLE